MAKISLTELPVFEVLEQVSAAARSGAVIVTAPPGSGKTMLVPPRLLDDLPDGSRVVVVQPRQLATRAVARQLAHLRNCTLGGEVGYQVRFDNCTSRDTRLIVATTGILLRRLLDDISLDGVGAVVLDEFHERSIELDLLLGLLMRVRSTLRPDLRLAVMSATLDTVPVARLLGDCPVVSTAGRLHPVDLHYATRLPRDELPGLVADAVEQALRRTAGHVLVFLPGAGEIRRCQSELGPLVQRQQATLLPLYGELPADQQDQALADLGCRKVILATNVAETSLTIDGVTAVVDSGLARQLSVSPTTSLPRLELTEISQASADQRAGRAGRTGPGHCWRLWSEASHRTRPAFTLPEVERGDLADPLLRMIAIGEADDFPWLNPPSDAALECSRQLLHLLGAIDAGGRITRLGHQLARLPAHPRLGRLLQAGAELGVLREASLAAALLTERDPFRPARHAARGPRDHVAVTSHSDVVDRVAALQAFHAGQPLADADLALHPPAAAGVLRAAEQLYRLADFDLGPRAARPDLALMQALLVALPDRLVRLRPGSRDRGIMVGGRGVRLDRGSRVTGVPLLLAIDVDDGAGEVQVRMASAVERSWIPDSILTTRDELWINPSRGQVESRRRVYVDDLMLEETPTAITDPAAAARLLAAHAAGQLERVLPDADSAAGRFALRVTWLADALPGLELPRLDQVAVASLLPQACVGRRSIDELRRVDWLPLLQAEVGYDRLAEIERLAPAEIVVASGVAHQLTYSVDQPPVLAVRIQELFGTPQTPTVAGGRVPVTLQLLGPNYRPQQVTRDLPSFWQNTYPEVKKELRRRYPKHAWPDDPLAALATRSGLPPKRS